jgi:hypothetical protein
VENLSGSPADFQLLYHINLGEPLLNAGSRLVAPVEMVVPRDPRAAEGISSWDTYGPDTPGFVEQVYFMKLDGAEDGMTQTLLTNSGGSRGISVKFNRNQLPYYTLWKNTTSSVDGYVTGLEPGTNFPNPHRFERQQGRVVRLDPGAGKAFDLVLEMHSDSKDVAKAEQEVAALRKAAEPHVQKEPLTGWCPL